MKMLRLWFLAGLVALLSACASGPKMMEVKSSIPPLKSNEGRIYFYRVASMVGAAIQPSISLNGTVVGESKPGGFFFVDRAPGSIEVVTATEVERKLTFTLAASETRYVRTTTSFGVVVGRVQAGLVDRAEAEKELEETSYTGVPLGK